MLYRVQAKGGHVGQCANRAVSVQGTDRVRRILDDQKIMIVRNVA